MRNPKEPIKVKEPGDGDLVALYHKYDTVEPLDDVTSEDVPLDYIDGKHIRGWYGGQANEDVSTTKTTTPSQDKQNATTATKTTVAKSNASTPITTTQMTTAPISKENTTTLVVRTSNSTISNKSLPIKSSNTVGSYAVVDVPASNELETDEKAERSFEENQLQEIQLSERDATIAHKLPVVNERNDLSRSSHTEKQHTDLTDKDIVTNAAGAKNTDKFGKHIFPESSDVASSNNNNAKNLQFFVGDAGN